MPVLRNSLLSFSILLIPWISQPGLVRAQLPADTVAGIMANQADPTQQEPPSEAAIQFEKMCYSCHTVGQGDKKGPDLKGVNERRSKEWLLEYLPSPTAMVKRGDPTAVELFKKYAPEVMTDQALSASQVSSILDFISALTQTNKPFVPSGARLSREPVPEDIPLGEKLFWGQTTLQNGGPACVGCHSIAGTGILGGGTLGPDLTQVNVKYTLPELINILQNPNFPLMSKVFAGKNITDEEIVRLVALFQDKKTAQPLAAKFAMYFLYLGIGLTVVLIVFFNWIWRFRFTGVRKSLAPGSDRG